MTDIMQKFAGRPQSTNIEDRRAIMGQGQYAIPQDGQPLGWDYDTLTTLMQQMGLNPDDYDDSQQGYMLEGLEDKRATDNTQGQAALEELLPEILGKGPGQRTKTSFVNNQNNQVLRDLVYRTGTQLPPNMTDIDLQEMIGQRMHDGMSMPDLIKSLIGK